MKSLLKSHERKLGRLAEALLAHEVLLWGARCCARRGIVATHVLVPWRLQTLTAEQCREVIDGKTIPVPGTKAQPSYWMSWWNWMWGVPSPPAVSGPAARQAKAAQAKAQAAAAAAATPTPTPNKGQQAAKTGTTAVAARPFPPVTKPSPPQQPQSQAQPHPQLPPQPQPQSQRGGVDGKQATPRPSTEQQPQQPGPPMFPPGIPPPVPHIPPQPPSQKDGRPRRWE